MLLSIFLGLFHRSFLLFFVGRFPTAAKFLGIEEEQHRVDEHTKQASGGKSSTSEQWGIFPASQVNGATIGNEEKTQRMSTNPLRKASKSTGQLGGQLAAISECPHNRHASSDIPEEGNDKSATL
jgi:hypothetical protein